ncbi:MAG: hypothetical protein RRY03_06870, partial [Oscillospiraceae bacterium]
DIANVISVNKENKMRKKRIKPETKMFLHRTPCHNFSFMCGCPNIRQRADIIQKIRLETTCAVIIKADFLDIKFFGSAYYY